MHHVRGVIALLPTLVLTGCLTYVPVDSVRMYNSGGIVIEGEDSSFRIEGDRPQKAPFHSQCTSQVSEAEPQFLVGQHQLGLAEGGRRVRVVFSDGKPPLHGVLALCSVPSDNDGPKTGMYSVSVPAEEIKAVRDGDPRVVAERYSWWLNAFMLGETRSFNTWVLWLSNTPLR